MTQPDKFKYYETINNQSTFILEESKQKLNKTEQPVDVNDVWQNCDQYITWEIIGVQ